MGYFPNSFARSLTMKKSFTLGVIFVEDLGVGIKHPFFSAVIEGFKRRVEKFGYDLIFINRYIGKEKKSYIDQDRKSTRLNSSHVAISYAVFCLKKKK